MSLMMPVKGVKRFRDRHGKWRHYHRASGKPIQAEWGTPEFLDELGTLNGLLKKEPARGGTLKDVFDEFRTTYHWQKGLKPATRKGYEKYFALVEFMHGVPVRLIDAQRIATTRDRIALKRGVRTANYVRTTLSMIMGFATERGYIKVNPVSAVKTVRKPKGEKRANRPWTIAEAKAVMDGAPWSIKLPLALCMFTGLRKSDALGLTKDAIAGETLTTSKTGEEISVVIHPHLRRLITESPRHDAHTVAANSRGEPWTSSGFDSTWTKFKTRLEKDGLVGPDLTIHGLRHTVGYMLAEAGCDLDTIRRVLGQRTLTMAQHYTDRARKHAAMTQAAATIDPLGIGFFPASQDEIECQTICQTDDEMEPEDGLSD